MHLESSNLDSALRQCPFDILNVPRDFLAELQGDDAQRVAAPKGVDISANKGPAHGHVVQAEAVVEHHDVAMHLWRIVAAMQGEAVCS